jgi:hypothetical protein
MMNGKHDPKITSLDEARRKAAEKARAAKRASRWPGSRGGGGGTSGRGGSNVPRTPRDWLLGGLFIAMALGMVVWAVMWIVGQLPGR